MLTFRYMLSYAKRRTFLLIFVYLFIPTFIFFLPIKKSYALSCVSSTKLVVACKEGVCNDGFIRRGNTPTGLCKLTPIILNKYSGKTALETLNEFNYKNMLELNNGIYEIKYKRSCGKFELNISALPYVEDFESTKEFQDSLSRCKQDSSVKKVSGDGTTAGLENYRLEVYRDNVLIIVKAYLIEAIIFIFMLILWIYATLIPFKFVRTRNITSLKYWPTILIKVVMIGLTLFLYPIGMTPWGPIFYGVYIPIIFGLPLIISFPVSIFWIYKKRKSKT